MELNELNEFDMQAGAEKRQKNRCYILNSGFRNYLLVLIYHPQKTIYTYFGFDYFGDMFNGLCPFKNLEQPEKDYPALLNVYDWRCFNKHFQEGSVLRNRLEHCVKNYKDYDKIIYSPYANSYTNKIIEPELYTLENPEIYDILIKNYGNKINKYKVFKLKYSQNMIFDIRNADSKYQSAYIDW